VGLAAEAGAGAGREEDRAAGARPHLAAVPWAGRPVFVVFDSDAIGNENIKLAERA
jgi:hypothetical protein